MEAAEAKLQRVLAESKQFLIPHFQRPYPWRTPEWETLWDDLLELTGEENAMPDFLGSIVTAPARSMPEGVEKRLLIDGQQRLTTIGLERYKLQPTQGETVQDSDRDALSRC